MPTTAPKFLGLNLRAEYESSPVTPNDSVDLPSFANQLISVGLQVTGAGNVAVQLKGGGTATLTGLAAGQIVDISVSRVLATGTTATGISSLWVPQG